MLFALHVLLVLIVALRVLSREYFSPVKRIAWLFVLGAVPIFGVVGYGLFGEAKLLQMQSKHDKVFKKIKTMDVAIIGDGKRVEKTIDQAYRAPFQFAQSINGFGLMLGNKGELLADAEDTRTRMVADFDAAKTSINIIYYIWLQDETGTQIVKALCRAAKRGVICNVMADGLGSRKMAGSSLWREMKDAGVNLSVALPLTNWIKTLFLSRIDLRNHRKITVIDGAITYCGSQNCSDPEFRPKKKYAPWVDIMLRFEGPVASQNQLLFASDWALHEETNIQDFVKKVSPFKDGIPAQVWGDGPTDRLSASPQLFASLINTAQKKLIISTPYFVPEETVLGAIYTAGYRGVDVTMIFPNRNDSWIVRAASQSYYKELLDAGVKIYEYEGGLLHAKTLTIDGQVSMIGSTNIDLRSFDLNYENNMLIYDEALTGDIEARQKTYIKSSSRVEAETVDNWSLPKRIWTNIVATIGPVL